MKSPWAGYWQKHCVMGDTFCQTGETRIGEFPKKESHAGFVRQYLETAGAAR